MGIGTTIKAIRTAKGMSLQELSDRCGGISKGYIFRLEQEDSPSPSNPSIGILTRIAEGLGVSLADLTKDESEDNIDQEWRKILQDPELQMLFRDLSKLTEKDREIAIRHVKMLRKMQEEQKRKSG